jgi:hypothetical protein
MFHQLSAVILPSLIKGRHNNTNNNKAKCIPGGTLRVLAGKKDNLNRPDSESYLQSTLAIAATRSR